MQRPRTVTILAIVTIALGFLKCLGAADSMFWQVPLSPSEIPSDMPLIIVELPRPWSFVMSPIVGMLTGVVLIALGGGLWWLQPWARVGSLACIVYLVFRHFLLCYERWLPISWQNLDANSRLVVLAQELLFTSLALLYPAALLYFLTRPRVVAAFRRNDVSETPTNMDRLVESLVSSPSATTNAENPYASPMTIGRPVVTAPFVPSQVHNSSAFISYYLGPFSILPCAGIPVGIGAVILGIIGLRWANRHPGIRGRRHAWVGIVCGAILGLLNILAIYLIGRR